MKREKLLTQARKLHLNTKEKVLDKLVAESEIFERKLAHFHKINVENVKPMPRPIEKTIIWMREDIPVDKTSNKKVILANAPTNDENYITLTKVVGHD